MSTFRAFRVHERDGGYAERVRAPADAVVGVPDGLGLREAMALGTGEGACLAIDALTATATAWGTRSDRWPRNQAAR